MRRSAQPQQATKTGPQAGTTAEAPRQSRTAVPPRTAQAAARVRRVGKISSLTKPHGAGTDITVRRGRSASVVPTKASVRPSERPAWAPDERSRRLVDVLGNKAVAGLLGVSASQPSRWKSGAEVPGTVAAPLLVDLDHVVARLLLIWDKSLVGDWLTTPNGFLEGARPIDVLARRGSTEVVEAIEAEAAGAYA